MSELTPDQKKAHDTVIDWYESDDRPQLLTLGGYAGTGKTFTIGKITERLNQEHQGIRLAFMTFTAKASLVLKGKVGEHLGSEDYCGTIHGFMYVLVGRNPKTKELIWQKKDEIQDCDLIIIDEASMVGHNIFRDVSHYGIPILAVGDHGQLPPIRKKSEPYLNLMENPEIRLEKIVRQQEDSPIIRMAQMARETGNIPHGNYGSGCIKTWEVKHMHAHEFDSVDSIMLCATHKTRVRQNDFAREILGNDKSHLPLPGEPVICLRNNYSRMVFNGSIGILKELNIIDDEEAAAKVDLGGEDPYEGTIDLLQFGQPNNGPDYEMVRQGIDYFDFGYCITTWKAQGSEWKNVFVMEEYHGHMDFDTRRRFLYTACTRAKERLVIFQR